MFRFLLFSLLSIVVSSVSTIQSQNNNKLCSPSLLEYQKCLSLVEIAKESNSFPLRLACKRESSDEACIESVAKGTSDIFISTGHDYPTARNNSLKPIIFEKLSDSSIYVAVIDRSITNEELSVAPLLFNESDHNAVHSAIFFNHQRGHDICEKYYERSLRPSVRIVNSATYKLGPKEILLCPDMSRAEAVDYAICNVEAELQRAVFVRTSTEPSKVKRIQTTFNTILRIFGPNSQFNFFDSFFGVKNVIFTNNPIAFDLEPTYRNGVDEEVFSYLHCDSGSHFHDESQWQ